jgi:hypothetical protein
VPLPAPGLALALALGPSIDGDELLSVADWLGWMPESLWQHADLDVLCALADFDDPAGAMDAGMMTWTLISTGPFRGQPVEALVRDYKLLRQVRAGPMTISNSSKGAVRVTGADSHLRSHLSRERDRLIHSCGLSAADAERQTFRLFLKAAGVPERVSDDGESLQVWESGTWWPLLVPPPVAGDWD